MHEMILTKSTEVRRTGDDADCPQALRVYPASPCSVHLQVRAVSGKKTRLYAGVDLSQDEVAKLRDYLTYVLQEHFGEGS